MKSHSRLARGQQVGAKVVAVFNKRMQVANDKFTKRVSEAFSGVGAGARSGMAPSVDPLGWANYAVDAAQRSGTPYEGAVALGCVIRGETLHFEIVSQESARALLDLAVTRRFPIGNGILTVDTDAQAWSRARPDEADKGGDAARAALSLVRLARRLAAGRP